MELKKLSEHIWYMPFEEERDRPNLGYVKGDKMSLAIDAGHSESHVREFYDLLQKEGLPLPSLTVITHLTQRIQHSFMCAKTRRSSSVTQPARNLLPVSRTENLQVNWQTRSARPVQSLASRATGSLLRLKTRWEIS